MDTLPNHRHEHALDELGLSDAVGFKQDFEQLVDVSVQLAANVPAVEGHVLRPSGGAIGAAGGAAIGAITGGSAVTGALIGGAAGAATGALTSGR
jgi:hypothetical protein